MRVILVGPPFIGKSTLLKHFEAKGYSTFNSDEYVEKIYKKDQKGYILIKEDIAFGDQFVNEKGVDKIKLGNEVSKDYDKFLRLNELIHPLISEKYFEKEYMFAEIPLTLLSKLNLKYDKIILLKPVSENVIIERIKTSDRKINKQFIDFILKKWNFDFDFENLIEIDQNSTTEQIAKQIESIIF